MLGVSKLPNDSVERETRPNLRERGNKCLSVIKMLQES